MSCIARGIPLSSSSSSSSSSTPNKEFEKSTNFLERISEDLITNAIFPCLATADVFRITRVSHRTKALTEKPLIWLNRWEELHSAELEEDEDETVKNVFARRFIRILLRDQESLFDTSILDREGAVIKISKLLLNYIQVGTGPDGKNARAISITIFNKVYYQFNVLKNVENREVYDNLNKCLDLILIDPSTNKISIRTQMEINQFHFQFAIRRSIHSHMDEINHKIFSRVSE